MRAARHGMRRHWGWRVIEPSSFAGPMEQSFHPNSIIFVVPSAIANAA
jgi:hypothetical protein